MRVIQQYTVGWLLISLLTTVQANSSPIQLLAATEKNLILEFSLPPFEPKGTDENCQQIQISNWVKTSEIPNLPVTAVLMQVPEAGKIEVEIIDSRTETLVPFNPCLTETSSLFSPDLVEIEPRAIWRNVPVARLMIHPFQWQAWTQELHYFTYLRLQIHFEQPLPPTRTVRSKTTDPYQDIFQTTLINYRGEVAIPQVRKVRENEVEQPLTEITTSEIPTRFSKEFDALRIAIQQEGIYRIYYDDLIQSGLNPALIDPRYLQLFNHDQAVAIKVITQQANQLQAGDYLEFYVAGLDNWFTNTNIYWLYWRQKMPGQRMLQIDGTATGQEPVTEMFYERLHLEENHELWEMTPGAPLQDYFFWNRFNADGIPVLKAYLLETPSPVLEEAKAFNVRVAFQGRSNPLEVYPNHHTTLYLNEVLIGDEYWGGDIAHLQEARATSTLLKEENSLLVVSPGDTEATVDTTYLNWIEIEYWRRFVAVNDRLKFNLRSAERTRVEVDGLSQPEIKIYDITNPFAVAEIVNFTVEPNNSHYKVIFADQAPAGKTYYVTTQFQRPTELLAWQTTHLKSPKNAADYILITTQEFLPAVEPLCVLRRKQGRRVQAVTVEQIYNEFNQGVVDPVAIKKFLKYAYEHWSPPAPTDVFLVGDANTDYRGYLGGDKVSRVPVHLSNDSVSRVTPDDNWYVTVQGDDVLPEMMIGRIPGDSVNTVARNIDKIVRYELFASPAPRKVLLVADGKEEYEMISDDLFNHYIQPAGFEADRVYIRNYLTDSILDNLSLRFAAEDIHNSMNQHVFLTNYVGHGAVSQWGFAKRFFGSLDVEWLDNVDKLSFVLALTCGNGYPSLPIIYSFADQFVMAPYKGAIAYFSSSSLSQPMGNEMLSNEVFSRIFQQGDRRLGSITMQAKVAAYSKGAPENIMRIYTLFGDPAVVLKD